MNKNRRKVKAYAKANDVKQWEIAEHLGVSEFTISRYMRHPDDKMAATYIKAIDDIRAEREGIVDLTDDILKVMEERS